MSLKKRIKQNYNNMMKIDKNYEETIGNIVCYLRGELNGVDAEEAINDVIEILLSAQERGEDLSKVIGDYKIFCNETVKAYKGSDKNYGIKSFFMDYSLMIVFSFVFFIGLDIILQLITSKVTNLDGVLNFNYTLSLAPIVSFLIITIVSIKLVKLMAINSEKINLDSKKNMLKATLIYSLIIGTMVVANLVFRNVKLYSFTDTPILIIIGILGAFLFISGTVVNLFKISRFNSITNKV